MGAVSDSGSRSQSMPNQTSLVDQLQPMSSQSPVQPPSYGLATEREALETLEFLTRLLQARNSDLQQSLLANEIELKKIRASQGALRSAHAYELSVVSDPGLLVEVSDGILKSITDLPRGMRDCKYTIRYGGVCKLCCLCASPLLPCCVQCGAEGREALDLTVCSSL